MKHDLLRLTGGIALLLGTAAMAEAADYKRLSTQWKGPNMPLDIINGGARNNFAQLAKKDDVSGQMWKITKADDWLNLTTEFRGDKMCLDVENGGNMNNFVKLERCENNSGQSWKITKAGDGDYVRLTTEFRGAGMCLDIVNGGARDGMAQLTKCSDVSGQLWRITDVTLAEAPSSSAPAASAMDRLAASASRAAAANAAPPAPAAPAVPAVAASESAHIEKAMTFPGDGDVPPQTVFSRDTPKIVLALAVRAVKAGDTITTTWIAEKTEGTAPNFTIGTIAIPLETSAVVASSFSKPDAGWPAGQYRVDVSHNGGPLEFSQRFTVKE